VPEPTPEPGVQNQASVEDMEPESLPFAEDAEPVEDTVYEPISSTVEDPGPPSEVGEEDRMEPFRWDQEDVGQSHSYSAPPAQTSRPPADFEPEMSMPAFSMSEEDLDAETAEALDPVAEVTGNVAMDAPTAKAKLLATLEKTEEGRALVPLVEQLKPTACRGMVLQLGYDESVSAEDLARLRGKDTERLLQQCMQEAFDSGNAKVLVRRWLAGLSDDQKPGMRLATVEEELQVRNRPLVQQVLELFGGDVIDVRINDRARESSDG
jgi:hypothetical protein